MKSHGRKLSRWVVRGSVVGLLAVLCFLAGFSILTQRGVSQLSARADRANRASEIYQDARFWVGQEESLERKYRLEPGPEVMALHTEAEQNLVADLKRLDAFESVPGPAGAIDRLLVLHARYVETSARMLRAVDAGDPRLVIRLDHDVVDPVFGQMEDIIYGNASAASREALAKSAQLRSQESAATRAIAIAFAVGLALLLAFGLVIAGFRRRLDAAQAAETERLAEIAITDPLTGLRNHRAFHEDLARSIHRVGRNSVPVALVMLDLDDLKVVNDTHGHQAGDEQLRALADAIRISGRGTDSAYRIGGDEFAVILDSARAWSALEFVERMQAVLSGPANRSNARASAGISEALSFTDKDTLIREADMALISSKRSGRNASVYTSDMEAETSIVGSELPPQRNQALANALVRAVDAKDSYTRSHSQTVSQLCALIAAELGLEPQHVEQIRLAALLHDVGRIGVPDAILRKQGKLTEEEFEQMQAHSILGDEILSAAGLRTEARWIRHHHERYDGDGYPDRIAGDEIPIESRIIFAADAFEAMTSDRPYREGPGHDYALAELRRHAGDQFDPDVVDALTRAIGTASQGTDTEATAQGATS